MWNRQLTDFLESYKLLPIIQSGFRSCHSTEWWIYSGWRASNVATVTPGVPQGSGLGPLFFILYTADISFIKRSSTSKFTAMPMTVSCISTKGPHPWWRTFLLVSPKSRDGWHRTGGSWIPTKPSSLTLESSLTTSCDWRTMFVALALPGSTSFVSSVSCVEHSHPVQHASDESARTTNMVLQCQLVVSRMRVWQIVSPPM